MSPQDEADLRRLILAEYRRQVFADAACSGKHGFDSPDQARRSSLFHRDVHGRVSTYRCYVCHKWHIGNHMKPKAAERKPLRRAA